MYPMEHIWTIVMLEICKHTFYAYLSRIWKMMQFTGFIRKVFATKILLSGKFSTFLTLQKTFKIKVVKDWSLSTSPCNIFLNNWRHLFRKEERTWSKFGSLFSPFVLPTDRKLTVRIFHFQQKFFPVKSPLEDKLQRIHVSTFIP